MLEVEMGKDYRIQWRIMRAFKTKLSALWGSLSYSTNSMPTTSAGEPMNYMEEHLLAELLMHCNAISVLEAFGSCPCFRDSFLMQIWLKIL